MRLHINTKRTGRSYLHVVNRYLATAAAALDAVQTERGFDQIERDARKAQSAPGERLTSDRDIAMAVADAIEWITTVPTDDLGITVHNGWVTLKGAVEDWQQKHTVEDTVQHLPCVRGVTSSITVRPRAISLLQVA